MEEALAVALWRGKGAALSLRAERWSDARQPMPEGGSHVWLAAMEAGEEDRTIVKAKAAAIIPIASHTTPHTTHIAQDGRNLSCAFALFPRRFPAHCPRIALPAAHHRLHCKPHPDLLTSTNRPCPSSLSPHPGYYRRTMGGNPQGRAQEEDQSHVALSKSSRLKYR